MTFIVVYFSMLYIGDTAAADNSARAGLRYDAKLLDI